MATDGVDNPLLESVGGGITREELRDMLQEVVRETVPTQTDAGMLVCVLSTPLVGTPV